MIAQPADRAALAAFLDRAEKAIESGHGEYDKLWLDPPTVALLRQLLEDFDRPPA